MELDLRWKRVGRNGDESNTGKREKMDKARTACSFFDARNKRRRGTEGWGEGQESGQRKGGQGGDVRYSFSLSHIGLLSLLRSPEWSERRKKRRVKSRENEKYNRKLAFVRRVVAKERKEIQKQK